MDSKVALAALAAVQAEFDKMNESGAMSKYLMVTVVNHEPTKTPMYEWLTSLISSTTKYIEEGSTLIAGNDFINAAMQKLIIADAINSEDDRVVSVYPEEDDGRIAFLPMIELEPNTDVYLMVDEIESIESDNDAYDMRTVVSYIASLCNVITGRSVE